MKEPASGGHGKVHEEPASTGDRGAEVVLLAKWIEGPTLASNNQFLPAMADAAITASKAESARPAIRLDGQGPRRIMTALENLVPARAAAQDSVG